MLSKLIYDSLGLARYIEKYSFDEWQTGKYSENNRFL